MTPVVLMAGGRGLRLHPLTENKPKPMLNVGGKPILETIIEGFVGQGFKKLWLCVNYRKELIEEYFKDGSGFGARIKYIEERQPLGTGGALHLLPAFDVPYIVANADVLARVNYGKLMEHHARSGAQATVCLALHQLQLAYGVAETEDGYLKALKEKPVVSWPVNAGIYVLEPKVHQYSPAGAFDMPDLISRLDRVAVYPLETQEWRDVGRLEDYARANAEWR